MKRATIIFLILISITQLYGQAKNFNEQEFFENLKTSYYSLKNTGTKNISVLLTNVSMETFASREWNNPEIFPLQLIWIAPERIFISQQGVPSLSDSSKKVYNNLVKDLTSQITDILFDLKRFYFSDIYSGIAENYEIKNVNDVVQITLSSKTNTDTTFYKYYFGLNGMCLKIISQASSSNLKVVTIPHFKISKTKWIATGWEVQISSDDEIQTGYVVDINYREKKNIWIPRDLVITVQRKTVIGQTFNEVLKFRNLLFNQPLHYLD